MLNIDITELKEKRLVMRIQEPEDTFDLKYEDLCFAGETKIDVYLVKIGRMILVRGKNFLTLRMICARCLEEFLYPMNIDINLQYRPQEESGREQEEEIEVTYYSGTTIDLSEDIRQAILLAIPVKPICRENCQGLCPFCGQNLNLVKCECSPPSDSRWSKLQEFLKSDNLSPEKGGRSGQS